MGLLIGSTLSGKHHKLTLTRNHRLNLLVPGLESRSVVSYHTSFSANIFANVLFTTMNDKVVPDGTT